MEYLLLAFSVLLGSCKSIVAKLARCPSGDLKGTAKINLISFSCALIVLFFCDWEIFSASFVATGRAAAAKFF